jgi:hypothetical protein
LWNACQDDLSAITHTSFRDYPSLFLEISSTGTFTSSEEGVFML